MVEPVQASTVVLIRDTEEGLQVYLLRRSSGSHFMAGNYVFPGGTVDDEDGALSEWKGLLDLDRKEAFPRFGGDMDPGDAAAHGIAAVRETFEEAGVLLAEARGQEPAYLPRMRAKLEQGAFAGGLFRQLTAAGGWSLSLTRLWPWAHWITPEAMPRRYDTRFFVAFMPGGQRCSPDSRETTHGIWISPVKALEGNLQGDLPLSPPTVVTLYELLQYSGLNALKKKLGKRQWGEARMPRAISFNGGPMILLPWDPMYRAKDIPEDEYEKAVVLSVEEPFSRLLCTGGFWRPVSMGGMT
jgi:8-oxo-dGTP pyrophosphatase MutT (NUDIX family)